jgi:hypothetical protein
MWECWRADRATTQYTPADIAYALTRPGGVAFAPYI